MTLTLEMRDMRTLRILIELVDDEDEDIITEAAWNVLTDAELVSERAARSDDDTSEISIAE